MIDRHLTPEERRLWHESNRQTRDVKKHSKSKKSDEENSIETQGKPSPSLGRGLGDGRSRLAPSLEFTSLDPHPDLPPKKGEGKAASRPRTSSRLVFLPARESAKRFRHHPVSARLDLHGYTKLDAREAVFAFLARQQAAGHRHVVIITGKGKGGAVGVLRASLPDWLNEPAVRGLIAAIAYAKPQNGGEGLTHVLLCRN